jgi:DNA replication ATP-dependent helicase Dna2
MDAPLLDHSINDSLTEETAEYLKQLERLVLDESETQRNEILRIWSKPLSTRVAEGRAIDEVKILSFLHDGDIELECDTNNSRFREGDILCLNLGDPFSQPSFMVTLNVDEGTRFRVSADDPRINWGDIETNKSGWILDEGFLDLTMYFLDALNEAGDTANGRERVLPLLMGNSKPKCDPIRYQKALELGSEYSLDWSQTEALAQAYATDSAYLVQGPPGTGKTRVLAYLAKSLVNDGERVLITALTHRAINNALNMLNEIAPEIPAIKIGLGSRAYDLEVENYEMFFDSPFADESHGYVVGATPFATRTSRLMGVEFETVIFDEASQITLPLAVMGMLPARKTIFVGDHKQLPPVLVSRPIIDALLHSVFAVLTNRGFETMLEETYRLNKELAQWPSRTFYKGILKPIDFVASRRISYPRKPARFKTILDAEKPLIFFDLQHRNATTSCSEEAKVVAELIVTLLECGILADQIGVVTPYRAQARVIKNALRTSAPDPNVANVIVVDTVERMQGQERDIIIISLTTSNPAYALNLGDFFFQPERLNVAITRSRKKLIIIGSSHVTSINPDDQQLKKCVELLRDLFNNCTYLTLDLK